MVRLVSGGCPSASRCQLLRGGRKGKASVGRSLQQCGCIYHVTWTLRAGQLDTTQSEEGQDPEVEVVVFQPAHINSEGSANSAGQSGTQVVESYHTNLKHGGGLYKKSLEGRRLDWLLGQLETEVWPKYAYQVHVKAMGELCVLWNTSLMIQPHLYFPIIRFHQQQQDGGVGPQCYHTG